MVSYNQFSEVGDSTIVGMGSPLVGVTSLYGYFDDTYGETEDRYFLREFSYSNDGITFSAWVELTSYNLQAVEVVNNRIFDLKIRYTRMGSDSSGLLKFNNITIQAKFIDIPNPISFEDSFLSDFFDFNSTEVLGWAINVLQKIYTPGIVPAFVERSRDFIDFWGIITHWFAIQVHYARQFEDITQSSVLFLEYLKNKGLITDPEMTRAEMISLMENIYIEFRKRGTKNAIWGDSSELKRLLETKSTDEFLFCFSEKEKISWFLNQSSPVYRGNRAMVNAVKGYNYGEFLEIEDIPVTEGVSLVEGELNVSLDPVDYRGITADNVESLITVDPRIAYEIFVKFRVVEGASVAGFYFGVKGFDRESGSAEEVEVVSIETLLAENKFLETADGVSLSYYSIDDDDDDSDSDLGGVFSLRGCVFPESQESFTTNYSKLSVYLGRHLRMPFSVRSIIPELMFQGSGNVFIMSVQVRPINTGFSLGFIGMNSLILFWGLNNSGVHSKVNVTSKIDRYLIPAETKFIPVWLDEQIEDSLTPLVISSILTTNITCFALEDGEIIVVVTGGESPYEYSLDGVTFQEENNFTGLSTGTYTITVKDSEGSVLVSNPVTITRPSAISIFSIQVNAASVYGAFNGSVIISAGGGTAPLFYNLLKTGGAEWGYQPSNVFSGLGIGDYTVRVKDSNDCPYIESDEFEITQPAVVDPLRITWVDIEPVSSYGGSDGSITVRVAGGVTPYLYSLGTRRLGGSYTWGSYQSSGTFSGLSAKEYGVRVKDDEETVVTSLGINIIQPAVQGRISGFTELQGGVSDFYTYQGYVKVNGSSVLEFSQTAEGIISFDTGNVLPMGTSDLEIFMQLFYKGVLMLGGVKVTRTRDGFTWDNITGIAIGISVELSSGNLSESFTIEVISSLQ